MNVDKIKAALEAARSCIAEAMEHHIYDHDDIIPEDSSYVVTMALIKRALEEIENG